MSNSFSRHEAQAVELNQQLINWNIVVFNETFLLMHSKQPPSETTFALRPLSLSRSSTVMLVVLSGGTGLRWRDLWTGAGPVLIPVR